MFDTLSVRLKMMTAFSFLFFKLLSRITIQYVFSSKAEIERDDISEFCENNKMNTTRLKSKEEAEEEKGNNRAKIDEFVLIVSIKRFR